MHISTYFPSHTRLLPIDMIEFLMERLAVADDDGATGSGIGWAIADMLSSKSSASCITCLCINLQLDSTYFRICIYIYRYSNLCINVLN